MHRIPLAIVGLMVWAALGGPLQAAEEDRLAAVRAFFDRYQNLERNFDPELASLYHQDAVVWVTRIYSNGVVRQLKIPGDVYQLAIRQSMDAAAEHGDFNEYSDIRVVPQADHVRIEATRYNLWRNYRSPYSAVVRRGPDGEWRIVEERFETQVPQPATE